MGDICQVGTAGVEPVYQSSVQGFIDNTPSTLREEYSDGYHTFKELHKFRKMYSATLFNEWASHLTSVNGYGQAQFNVPKYDVHKSWRNYDGSLCFGGGLLYSYSYVTNRDDK